jgi:hypothetical protein
VSRPDEILDSLEASYRARLYQARWDEAAASEIVPQLVELLGSPSRDIVLRTLRALGTIGSAARAALAAALPYLGSSDPAVAEVAAYAIGCIAWRDPGAAVGPLVAAFRPGLEKPVMHALLGFGPAARSAAPVFAQAFLHKLAGVIEAVLVQARTDRSRAVREYAQKLFPHQGDGKTERCAGEPSAQVVAGTGVLQQAAGPRRTRRCRCNDQCQAPVPVMTARLGDG